MFKNRSKIKSFYILVLLVMLFIFNNAISQVYDIDPYLKEDNDYNNLMLKNYGYTLSLFLNSFEPARGNLLPGTKLGLIGKRTSVRIDKDNRTGILENKKKLNCDMMGFAIALGPKLNANILFHNGEDGGTSRRPLMWQGSLKYDLVGAKSLNHMYVSAGYGEVRYVKDYFFKHFTMEGVYNGRSRRAGYTVGVGVNRYVFDLTPSEDIDNSYYNSSIIKNLFKMNMGLQLFFQDHWQFSASYTRAYFTSYQFDLLFYF